MCFNMFWILFDSLAASFVAHFPIYGFIQTNFPFKSPRYRSRYGSGAIRTIETSIETSIDTTPAYRSPAGTVRQPAQAE